MPRRSLSTQEQEIQFRKIHGDKYDYDWSTYINNNKKMTIICSLHGCFIQSPDTHKAGIGCPTCGKKKSAYSRTLTFEEVVSECRKVHGDKYAYYKESYINNKEKMKIGCPEHGEFNQSSGSHRAGQECPKCANTKKSKSNKLRTLTFEESIIQCNKVHNNKYTYYKDSYVDNKTKMLIECDVHGIFAQTPNHHKNGHGCPMCNSSKGELKINQYLSINVDFCPQYKFNNCKHKGLLIFDFYIPEFNTCIEFDGEHNIIDLLKSGTEQNKVSKINRQETK